MLAVCLFKKLLNNKVTISWDLGGNIHRVLDDIINNVTLEGDEYEWYLKYRAIALVILGKKHNFGRVLVLLLMTRGFKEAGVSNERLVIWLEEVLSEQNLIEFDIPEACLAKVWPKSYWMILGCQLLIFVYLFTKPILF